jgi:hypothetical protein
MKTAQKVVLKGILVTLVVTGLAASGMAQFRNQSAIRDVVRRIQTRTDSLQRAVQNASERNAYRVDDLNRLVSNFEIAVNQLDRRLSSTRTNSAYARIVLDRAVLIDNFFLNNRIGAGTRREWQALRVDLDQLASYYNLTPSWSSGDTSGNYPGSANDYNLNDVQMRQLIQRIDSSSATFSRAFRIDVNRENDRYSADEIRRHLSEYETALVQVRNRVNSRQSTSSDVRELLEHASYLNTYVGDRQLSYQTENNWSNLRQDLDRLASAYNIAWNWSQLPDNNGNTGQNNDGRRRDLNGTFRLNTSRGDDARQAVDAATRNLSAAERQRVYDSMLRRLDPPQMIAIDRRGQTVTIASTRAPQINFTADGREQVETTQGGRQIRVRAAFQGDVLTITRTGERANDFIVTFDPVDNGRQLLVTRTLYTERVNQAVTVRTYYDRTSDVAQLNVYDTNREDSNVGGNVGGVVTGDFIVPNGTQIVAVLNNELSTQNVRENERFTMTVRSPGQYDGATIEGVVSNVERSGRITGRSQLTLDFDTIRLRDGRSYRFAGILEAVRTPSGEVVRIDNEGAVRDSNQTNKTVQRTAIGTAVGAIIGAIAGGGKGAAIGAVIGAGAGAGSVYVQGREDLNLETGTEVTIRSTGPRG